MADSFNTQSDLTVNGEDFVYYDLNKAAEALGFDLKKLPYTLKILLENLLRHEDGNSVTKDDIRAIADWLVNKTSNKEIAYRPARVLMQDFTGVPAVVDLAAMRDAVANLGGDPSRINPLSPVDLVIDHSVMVDAFGNEQAFETNVQKEMQRNQERYEFLRSGQVMFDNFRVVPPGTGICHQVNLEYLAKVVWTKDMDGKAIAYPDTLVGTDSHTTMINGLAVLGWGVGGIEAEAAMLGQPISMLIPEVVGFEFTGELVEGATATDLVLTVTHMLRERGVVGKFVEFFGDGLSALSLADRATISNMAPEYGATCGFFPIDGETIKYLQLTARDISTIALVERYAKQQGLWREEGEPAPHYTDSLQLDLNTVEPSIAGPKRPQDQIVLREAARSFHKLANDYKLDDSDMEKSFAVRGKDYKLPHGAVVIAAITSCTNTSNPSVMIGAGLVAKKALERGLKVKPWVKTSLAPGSKVVTEYLESTDLQDDLDALGFNLVGYGCTTCIGNSGPLEDVIETAIKEQDILTTSVLSGNRNFEGRVHQLTRGNYLMSPPLVVAYALAGNMKVDLLNDPLGQDNDGNDVFLKDIWPTNAEIAQEVLRAVTPEMFKSKYADVFAGTKEWQAIEVTDSKTYNWNDNSTYIQNPPYFEAMSMELKAPNAIKGARILALLGDSITTDHISPAGAIALVSPAAEYLKSNGVSAADFNSYGSRRGNHEVMMRGTFANIRIRNEMLKDIEGGFTKYLPTNEEMSIYDAAMRYKNDRTPLVVIGGKEYGTGSSRDWAAKGTKLLGVEAVIVESFERIHRSNLVGMGVLPLVFPDGVSRKTLNLDGSEIISITGIGEGLKPKMELTCGITYSDGTEKSIPVICRLDTLDEVDYFKHGGILHKVIRSVAA